ncbi:MAG: response regulator [Chloroflexi bacterium]|nr:response regulator [Chloroflexota bacterium]MCI0649102.1 response regulator [Chloroflexota bacterium]MCI0726996.1 response regulator [Chloroflexota bacterium]
MSLKGKHIFLLEDDVRNLAVISVFLRQNGVSFVHDTWGDTTLKKMLDYPFDFDLILLDLMISPKVSGYDVFDVIQKIEKFKDIPVVAVSAADPDIEIPKARAKGFRGFISKPLKLYDFEKNLIDVLNGKSVW